MRRRPQRQRSAQARDSRADDHEVAHLYLLHGVLLLNYTGTCLPLEIPVQVVPPYVATVARGGLSHAGALVRAHVPASGRVIVLTSPRVRGLWGKTLDASLRKDGLDASVLELPDGEEHKNLAELAKLAEAMVAASADREALLLAFGGGVIGDVGGFLASVYMRGVRLLQVPTTLLAMVDSSLGGKTGVNLAAGKNLVGTFYHPRAILADPDVLATLPEREFRSGLAEAIKYGIIGATDLFTFIEQEAAALRACRPEPLEQLIAACLQEKARVVAADERESDLRRVLNFGHTLGHALESATGYTRYLHGEAVAWGMIATTRIAIRIGRLSEAQGTRIVGAILNVCAPLPALVDDAGLLLRHAASDKKTRAGRLHFVLPVAIGRVEIACGIDEAVIAAALQDAAAIAARAPVVR
ncbi:MAG: 3-dehydroquinate synthase [Acidobacteria bacterium]|nr:MAG: 3-dehydroquinate synthase [Acidobacteriota bacterium]